ncbi:hypothetical protein [Aquabacterium sp.]|uniref:hypothetical protein n=1 Tax=Aquabacterium sp. TaxID=1872578 RepID=UPI00403827A1
MNTQPMGRLILEASTGVHGDAAKELAIEAARLAGVVSEVHSWIVCAAIASPDDMMQNAPHIAEITRGRA